MSDPGAARAAAEEIRVAVESGQVEMPPLPELVARVRERILSDDASPREIADMIRNDAAMTAAVIRRANSAAVGGLRPTTDLGQAVHRLGLRHIATVVAIVAHRGLFAAPEPDRIDLLRALWDHALATALGSQRLARAAGTDGEEAFLAGLLHDAGRLLALKGVDHLERSARRGKLPADVLEQVLDLSHVELGYRLLKAWKLPEPVCRAARQHHNGAGSDDLLVRRVQLSCAIARKIGAHPHPDSSLSLSDHPAVAALGLADLDIATLMVDVEDAVEQIHKLF